MFIPTELGEAHTATLTFISNEVNTHYLYKIYMFDLHSKSVTVTYMYATYMYMKLQCCLLNYNCLIIILEKMHQS